MAVRITNLTTTSCTIEWDSVGTGVVRYFAEIWTPDSSGTAVFSNHPVLSGSARSQVATGLVANRNYEAKVYGRNSTNGVVGQVQYLKFSTTIPTNPTLNLSVSGNTITATGSRGANTEYINFTVNGSYWTSANVTSSSTFSVTYVGNYNTSYTIEAKGRRQLIYSSGISKSATTGSPPPPPKPSTPTGLEVYEKTDNSFKLKWNASTPVTGYSIEIYDSSGSVTSSKSYGQVARSFATNTLSPDTYSAKVWAINGATASDPVYVYGIIVGRTRPSNWAWYSSKTSGGNLSLTAQEWNDFCDRINDFKYYKSQNLYTFTTAYTGNNITATIFNQARSALIPLPTTQPIPSLVSSDGIIYAHYFNTLRDCLNSIL